MSRSVTMQMANFGRTCPPLTMVRMCNEGPCPVPCVMGDWSGWGACTADCGGGVQQRSRSIIAPAENGGDPCGEKTEAMSCHVDDCDQECVLGDWSAWSPCSKKCDRGMNRRTKKVITPAIGQGQCWAERDEKRLEYTFCNEEPCLTMSNEVPKCHSKIDLMLLLDGSGSVGSAGWTKTIDAATAFIHALDGGADMVQVGGILFSGPQTKVAYDKCTGAPDSTGAAVDLEADCGIKLISHFTTDTTDLEAKVRALTWPRRTTLTSVALTLAKSEMALGRADAQSVVVVITDGKPLNFHKTRQAANKLRKKSRVMWVPVTANAPLKEIKKWASDPKSENVIRVEDFQSLANPRTLSVLMNDICPNTTTSDATTATATI